MTNSIADRLRTLALESVDERGNPLAVITSPGLIIDAANEIEGLQRELAMNQEFHNIDDVVEIRKLRAALEEIADLPATPEDGLSTATLIADFALSAGYSAPEPNDWRPIESAPRRQKCLFWVVPKTADETYVDSSGKPIVGAFEPYLLLEEYGAWSGLAKATHWMPAPNQPEKSGDERD